MIFAFFIKRLFYDLLVLLTTANQPIAAGELPHPLMRTIVHRRKHLFAPAWAPPCPRFFGLVTKTNKFVTKTRAPKKNSPHRMGKNCPFFASYNLNTIGPPKNAHFPSRPALRTAFFFPFGFPFGFPLG